MKVAVINFSGNVGKSTITHHLLAPRLNEAEIISVETINAQESNGHITLKGKEFAELQEALASNDAAIVDVGASNIEDFITLMKQHKSSHEDFDCFIIPTVPTAKQQRDTIATIDALSTLGIPSEKIRLIFNMVDYNDDPKKIFAGLIEYHDTYKKFTLPDTVIRENELYGKLKDTKKTIKEIINDPTDFKEKIKLTDSKEEKVNFARQLAIKRLAMGVQDELDNVFEKLFS